MASHGICNCSRFRLMNNSWSIYSLGILYRLLIDLFIKFSFMIFSNSFQKLVSLFRFCVSLISTTRNLVCGFIDLNSFFTYRCSWVASLLIWTVLDLSLQHVHPVARKEIWTIIVTSRFWSLKGDSLGLIILRSPTLTNCRRLCSLLLRWHISRVQPWSSWWNR